MKKLTFKLVRHMQAEGGQPPAQTSMSRMPLHPSTKTTMTPVWQPPRMTSMTRTWQRHQHGMGTTEWPERQGRHQTSGLIHVQLLCSSDRVAHMRPWLLSSCNWQCCLHEVDHVVIVSKTVDFTKLPINNLRTQSSSTMTMTGLAPRCLAVVAVAVVSKHWIIKKTHVPVMTKTTTVRSASRRCVHC